MKPYFNLIFLKFGTIQIPIILNLQSFLIDFAKSVILKEGIFGIYISPPDEDLIHFKTNSQASSSLILNLVIFKSVIGNTLENLAIFEKMKNAIFH